MRRTRASRPGQEPKRSEADLASSDPAFVSRRRLLGGAATAALTLVGVGVAGCKKAPLVCDGLPGIAPADLQLRTTLEYKDTSLALDRLCVDCTLFVVAQAEDTCGTCKVVRGPINPKGTCKVFLRRQPGGPPT